MPERSQGKIPGTSSALCESAGARLAWAAAALILLWTAVYWAMS